MTIYLYITASLILSPLLGWLITRKIKNYHALNKIGIIFFVFSSAVIVFSLAHFITISTGLNWFLLTSVYFTVSLLLFLTKFQKNRLIRIGGQSARGVIFGFGYLIAVLGFLFVMLWSNERTSVQKEWLTSDLIYFERNIGAGPDPGIREKKIEVFKTIRWFPILARRIYAKTYDEWNFSIQRVLDIRFSENDQILYLAIGNGDKKFHAFSDTINLNNKRSTIEQFVVLPLP